MRLHPRELEKLMLHYAGDLAKRRKERGIKLNYVESIAYISMEIMEKAREGKMSVAELMSYGKTLLKSDDVLSGVANLIEEVQVENLEIYRIDDLQVLIARNKLQREENAKEAKELEDILLPKMMGGAEK